MIKIKVDFNKIKINMNDCEFESEEIHTFMKNYDFELDDLYEIIKKKYHEIYNECCGRSSYIKYNKKTKLYDLYIDISYHGSPSYVKGEPVDRKTSKFLYFAESLLKENEYKNKK